MNRRDLLRYGPLALIGSLFLPKPTLTIATPQYDMSIPATNETESIGIDRWYRENGLSQDIQDWLEVGAEHIKWYDGYSDGWFSYDRIDSNVTEYRYRLVLHSREYKPIKIYRTLPSYFNSKAIKGEVVRDIHSARDILWANSLR